MTAFLASVKNEWMKLKAKKRTRVFIIILILLSVLFVVLHYTAKNRLGFYIVQSDHLAKTVLDVMLQFILPLFVFIMGVDSFTSEKSQGTLKMLLTRPVSRIKIYFAKLASLSMLNLVMVLTIYVIAAIGSLFNISEGFLGGTVEGLAACVLVIIPLGLISAWGLLTGQLFSNGTMTIGLGILAVFLLNIGQIFIDNLSFVTPMTYTSFYRPLINGNITVGFFIILLCMIFYYIILMSAGLLKLTTTEA